MSKFKVSIHGKNYRIRVEQRVFLFRKKTLWKQVGFYTTRFVESESANEAIKKIFEIVRAELKEDDRTTEHSTLELSEIQEDDNAYDLYAPGKGYTFYTENSE